MSETASSPGPVNRLAGETSPYLRQHARNPVAWEPWGAEALERARREDRPVFLSVGYSSCHWCHVMAHESFEDAGVAEAMNRLFVCVKVDREERPDIDQVYMTATQLLAGRGGWPNSVWLTPDGRPWFAGTYFPREDRGGMTGFRTVCLRLGELWATRRAAVEAQADHLAQAVRDADPGAVPAPAAAPGVRPLVEAALRELRAAFDPAHGGFGGAPKFPPHGELALLLAEHRRRGDPGLLAMAEKTLSEMAAGGIHDQVGGGFHRYATDARWFLPHFEKMLSDNARLLALYTEAWTLTRGAEHARAARGIAEWMLREMAAPGGGFYTALDADSEGGEGRFYLWTPGELRAALGAEEAAFAVRVFGATEEGNVRDEATGAATGANLPCLGRPVAELAAREGQGEAAFRTRRERVCAALLAARAARARPGLDDKILTAWNGLAIGALAQAGTALGEPRYLAAAARAAEFAWTHLRVDGRLLRTFTQGRASIPGFLDDHAFLADGFLDLHRAAPAGSPWLERAGELASALIERFRDAERGGFHFTAHDQERLIARPRDPYDGALPAGNAVACRVLQRLHAATSSELHRVMAEETARAFGGALRAAPRAAPTFLSVLAAGAEGELPLVPVAPPPAARPAAAPPLCELLPRDAVASGPACGPDGVCPPS